MKPARALSAAIAVFILFALIALAALPLKLRPKGISNVI
jgi:hypothetical protein